MAKGTGFSPPLTLRLLPLALGLSLNDLARHERLLEGPYDDRVELAAGALHDLVVGDPGVEALAVCY